MGLVAIPHLTCIPVHNQKAYRQTIALCRYAFFNGIANRIIRMLSWLSIRQRNQYSGLSGSACSSYGLKSLSAILFPKRSGPPSISFPAYLPPSFYQKYIGTKTKHQICEESKQASWLSSVCGVCSMICALDKSNNATLFSFKMVPGTR